MYCSTYYKSYCYNLIKNWWLSIIERKSYFLLQEEYCMKNIDLFDHKISPNRKSKYILRKYHRLTSNIHQIVDERESEVDKLIKSIDNNLSQSRVVFGKLEAEHREEIEFQKKS